MPKLGLIAGSGRFPVLLAEAAMSRGWEVVLFAVKDETDMTDYNGWIEKTYNIRMEQVGKFIESLLAENITDVVMAGKVHKRRLYGDLQPDERTIKMFMRLKDRADDTLLGELARELESEGITLHPTTFCAESLLAEEGTLTKNGPSSEQWKDIEFGWRIAKEIGGLDIGQAVVVKAGAVMAVEAIEGTDEAILRGGKYARKDAVVVKVAKPRQDNRLDMPAVGVNTIESMIKVNARVLAVEAGWTVVLDREKMLEMAEDAGIIVVACVDPGKGSAS